MDERFAHNELEVHFVYGGDDIMEFDVNEDAFVNSQYLRWSGFENELYELGFSDFFYDSILRYSRQLQYMYMDLYYDEAHTWPNEKLYRYIYQAFLSKNKKLERWTFGYGACSLFEV